MTTEISERAFEEAIEQALLQAGPDSPIKKSDRIRSKSAEYGDLIPGGYHKRNPEDYDRSLCLIPKDVIDFVVTTQPKEWARLKQHHGQDVKERFVHRVSQEIGKRGSLDVLREGVRDSGCKFRMTFFKPASGLNEELRRLHEANLFSVSRQVKYSEKNENCLDLMLFLNGIPIFTAELKNPLTGQTYADAIRQYMTNRDPREPLFVYGRCLAHFAVDADQVFVTTHLNREKTRFLPFNKGKFGGAGNPPIPPTQSGYSTAYLWEETWSKDSVLELAGRFVHEVEEEDENGKKTGSRFLIFPRYQQLDAVRRLVRHAKENLTGKRYLIQHSAGSGKSFTIAWLAHQLSVLHDVQDRRVFDSIVVVTDRRVLDRQLQRIILQFEQTLGVVENIDKTSRQLKEALENGKTIIVTTLQKFPHILEDIGSLPGKRFAVIIDEAHSSQSGESSRGLKSALSCKTLEEAEREDSDASTPEEKLDDAVLESVSSRGPQKNLSMFAFTATPKSKTLELFGVERPDGKFEPFHLYSMRQAIEEGFILDVLSNYTTYKAYWRLLKKIETDPQYDRKKAEYLLKNFVELHPHAIREKIKIMVEHFAAQSQNAIAGRAKAMIVTRSRLHAVRYKIELDRYLREKNYPFRSLVAFSGEVKDEAEKYTESGMNSRELGRTLGERQTAGEFNKPEYRFLVVANKFQTGFDQPLLHTMYVDKKLGGVNAVQTLSRLNRTCPGKDGVIVLDFANEASDIQLAFEPYYETTILSEATDPNLLYEKQDKLRKSGVFTEKDVETFAECYFLQKAGQDRLYAILEPSLQRFLSLQIDDQVDFRGQITDFVRLYAFLSQILSFKDVPLEKWYAFCRILRRRIGTDKPELPLEIKQNIDMESYQVKKTGKIKSALSRNIGLLDPVKTKDNYSPPPEDMEPLSAIIRDLNERFGLTLGPEHASTLHRMMDRLEQDSALDASARVNTRENVRLAFEHKVEDAIQEIVDSNFDLYKRITDDPDFGEAVKGLLFEQYIKTHRQPEELLKQHESKTLEFKSTLRWSLKENREDRAVTLSVLKTIAAFLNTEGGDLMIGVADDRSVTGLEADGFENEDKFMLHLMQMVRNALGDRSGTCVDPRIHEIQGKKICLVGCRKSPEPVYLKWKGMDESGTGDFYVRSGPGSIKLTPASAAEYIRTRFK